MLARQCQCTAVTGCRPSIGPRTAAGRSWARAISAVVAARVGSARSAAGAGAVWVAARASPARMDQSYWRNDTATAVGEVLDDRDKRWRHWYLRVRQPSPGIAIEYVPRVLLERF